MTVPRDSYAKSVDSATSSRDVSFDDMVSMLTALVDADLCQTLPGSAEGRKLPETAFTAKIRITKQLRSGQRCEAKSYSPQVFGEIRAYFGISNPEFMHYLTGRARFTRGKSKGKSGSYFLFSADRRFLLKSLSKSELLLLCQLLPEYYAHMIQNPHTLLPRFFGIYKIDLPSGTVFLACMNNVFDSALKVHKVFDLKGSKAGRKATETEKQSSSVVYKDIDWIEQKLRIGCGKERKLQLCEQLAKDCGFLRDHGIMDYSLLVGVHFQNKKGEDPPNDNGSIGAFAYARENGVAHRINAFQQDDGGMKSSFNFGLNHVYFMGLIDVLQLYNVKKKMEHGVKMFRFKRNEISSVDPGLYFDRFMQFAETLVD